MQSALIPAVSLVSYRTVCAVNKLMCVSENMQFFGKILMAWYAKSFYHIV